MDELAAKRQQSEEMMEAYSSDPNFIEQEYQVPPLEELLAGNGVVGVARLIELPSFSRERLHTFVYSESHAIIATVRGANSLWCSIAHFAYLKDREDFSEWEFEPFVAGKADRRSTTLSLSAAQFPALVSSWPGLIEAASNAPTCWNSMCDGVSYRHRVCAPGTRIDAQWSNPDRKENPKQVQLLAAYLTLLELADLFPEDREEAERRRLRNRENKLARKKRKQDRKREP
jgi:hypothetical protein